MQRYVAQQPPSSYSAVLARCVRRLIPPDFLLRYPYARRGAPSVTHTLDFVVRHGYVLLFFWILAEHGAPLYRVERLEDGTLGKDGKSKKTFRQSKADGRGGWILGMDGVRRV